jgi:hypothetical protein
MTAFRLGDQRPPEPRRITDAVVMRFDDVFEVDPDLMRTFPQQDIPAWDTMRIVDSRWDHLDWMHDHFADDVLSTGLGSETMPEGEAMPSEERAEPRPGPKDPGAGGLGL